MTFIPTMSLCKLLTMTVRHNASETMLWHNAKEKQPASILTRGGKCPKKNQGS